MSSTMRCTIGAASRNSRTGASLPLRGTQLRLPVRVRQAAHVEHEVGVGRQAVLVAERLDHDRHGARRARRDALANLLAQRVDRHARRVDDELGRVDDRREQLALLRDGFLEARLAVRQRMLAARLAETRQQHLRVGLQEDDLAREPVGAQLLHERRHLGEIARPAARVEADADVLERRVFARHDLVDERASAAGRECYRCSRSRDPRARGGPRSCRSPRRR